MTKQQKFRKPIKDCISLNLHGSLLRNFKRRSFAFESLSKGRIDSILKVSKVNSTKVIDVNGMCVLIESRINVLFALSEATQSEQLKLIRSQQNGFSLKGIISSIVVKESRNTAAE